MEIYRWADLLACSKIIDRVLKCEKNNGYSVRNLTFHRAFDVAQDAFKAVEIIKELGFSRVLTSGQVCTIIQYFEPLYFYTIIICSM